MSCPAPAGTGRQTATEGDGDVTTLFGLILAVIALAVLGIWLPVLWIVALALIVIGVLYLIGAGRSASRGGTTE